MKYRGSTGINEREVWKSIFYIHKTHHEVSAILKCEISRIWFFPTSLISNPILRPWVLDAGQKICHYPKRTRNCYIESKYNEFIRSSMGKITLERAQRKKKKHVTMNKFRKNIRRRQRGQTAIVNPQEWYLMSSLVCTKLPSTSS